MLPQLDITEIGGLAIYTSVHSHVYIDIIFSAVLTCV